MLRFVSGGKASVFGHFRHALGGVLESGRKKEDVWFPISFGAKGPKPNIGCWKRDAPQVTFGDRRRSAENHPLLLYTPGKRTKYRRYKIVCSCCCDRSFYLWKCGWADFFSRLCHNANFWVFFLLLLLFLGQVLAHLKRPRSWRGFFFQQKGSGKSGEEKGGKRGKNRILKISRSCKKIREDETR